MNEGDTLLYLDGVTVTFDGFRALNALSLTLNQGEMRAMVGPNGAGKTTMMDVITGKTRPDSGSAWRVRSWCSHSLQSGTTISFRAK